MHFDKACSGCRLVGTRESLCVHRQQNSHARHQKHPNQYIRVHPLVRQARAGAPRLFRFQMGDSCLHQTTKEAVLCWLWCGGQHIMLCPDWHHPCCCCYCCCYWFFCC